MDLTHFHQLDWDFPDQNSKVFLHNLCWYPSRFIPMIPAQLISALSQKGDIVLDPFGGAGTTLVEALRQKRHAVSVDLNPVSCFISKVKAEIYAGRNFELSKLLELSSFLKASKSKSNKQTTIFPSSPSLETFTRQYCQDSIPNEIELSVWYKRETFDELKAIYNYHNTIRNELTKDILKLIFISILMSASGHKSGRPYTYYADNVKPKNHIHKDALKQFAVKLNRFIKEFQSIGPFQKNEMEYKIIYGNTKNISTLGIDPVDLIVTSPPYLSVTDYNMAFRLAHLWFDWPDALVDLRKNEIGARYDRKKSSASSNYLKDMEICFSGMAKLLKKGKYLCVVIGESKKHHKKINDHLISYLTDKLKIKLIHSNSREISQKFFRHPSGGVNTEEILIFRR